MNDAQRSGCPINLTLEVVGDKAVAVSVDVGRKGETALVKWADQNGATWPVALMPTDFGQALVAEFGSQIVTPSGTPIIIIDQSGTPHVTEPGIKKSTTLVDLLNQWTPLPSLTSPRPLPSAYWQR